MIYRHIIIEARVYMYVVMGFNLAKEKECKYSHLHF